MPPDLNPLHDPVVIFGLIVLALAAVLYVYMSVSSRNSWAKFHRDMSQIDPQLAEHYKKRLRK